MESALLRKFLGCSRFVWNAILAENQARFEMGDPLPIKYNAFCERLDILKARHGFLRECNSQSLQQTLRGLMGAYQKAFNPKISAELPTFKKKHLDHGMRIPQAFKMERNSVYLPKIGWVAFRLSKRGSKRKILGIVKNVTVRLEVGKWYVSFQTEREILQPTHQHPESAVGIDVGVVRFAALSDETFCDGANAFQKHQRRVAIAQRRMDRKVTFSANWRKAKKRVGIVVSHVANIRKDQLHKASATISKKHAIVVMEDIRIPNMTASAKGTADDPGRNVAAKTAINRRILDQGWGEFRRQIGYKLDWLGGRLLLVNPRNTSRGCNQCGHISAENRLTQAAFECVKCGHASNADTNAAKNILGRAGCARIACGASQDIVKQEALFVA